MSGNNSTPISNPFRIGNDVGNFFEIKKSQKLGQGGNNSTPNDEWIRLNVGGKVFQTTRDTLSRYPDSFLARLVNGGLSSDKDESGAYLIDADPEHFGTILNYCRRGSVKLDGSKMNLEDLLREADFFNIEPLVIEIRQAMSAPDQKTEMSKQILVKLDAMSMKLSNLSTTMSTPGLMGLRQEPRNNLFGPPVEQKRTGWHCTGSTGWRC